MKDPDYLVSLVNRSFEALHIQPYTWQEDAVYLILEQFINENKKNVVLAADTGVGKSMIGAAVAIAMSIYLDKFNKPISMIMMHNNLLVDQYATSLESNNNFMRVKGATNFKCVIEEFKEPVDAGDCRLPAMRRQHKKSGDTEPMKVPSNCLDCEYLKQFKKIRTIPHIITNFQYHMAKTIKGRGFNDRPVAIFDEGHTLNDVAVDSMSIGINEDTFIQIKKAIEYTKKQVDMDASLDLVDKLAVFETLIENKHEYFKNTNITEKRFIELLKELMNGFVPVIVELENDHIIPINYEGLIKAIKRLDSWYSLFTSYFNNCELTEYVFDRNDTEKMYHIKPVFIKGLSDLILSDYNLFMSATITDEYMIETIGLKPEETEFIILPSVYPKDHKRIHCIAKGSVSYTTLQNPNTIKSLCSDITEIMNKHISLNHNGIAMTNSFKMAEDIYNGLPNELKKHVILHEKGEKVVSVIAKMKNSKIPVLLLSPSIFEGVDFKGDASSYQILLKAPYPSLSDKRISVIAHRYGNIYKTLTLMKIVQGIGRSVRSATEIADTYILDSNIEKLLYSPLNIWRHTHTLLRS